MSLPLGHIKIARKLFRSDPWWAEERVFSRFEAWIDILQLAAWKPRVVVYHGEEIALARGELVLSIRLAAERWAWGEKGTRLFLKRAQERERIRAQRETQAGTVYLVVKYDDYQSTREPKGTPEDTPEDTPKGEARAHRGHTEGTPRAQERSSKAGKAEDSFLPPRVASSPSIELCRAANQAIAKRWGESTSPLLAGHGQTHALAATIAEAGIPVEFAQRSIARQVLAKTDGQPKSMAYFRSGILDDWAKSQAMQEAEGGALITPFELARSRRPDAKSIAEDATAAALRSARRLQEIASRGGAA